MGAMGIWQWLLILTIVLILFGRGKIPGLLGDLGKGIRAFRDGASDDPQQYIEPTENDGQEKSSHA